MKEFTVIEKRGERSWRFTSEGKGKNSRGSEYYSPSAYVADAWRVSACAYFREILVGIKGDTVLLRVVHPSQAHLPRHWKKRITDWNFQEGDYSVVSNSGVMVGILSNGYLERSGYDVGDYAPFAVVFPKAGTELTLTNYVELFILENEKGKELSRQRAEEREKNLVRESVSIDLPANFNFFIVNIYEEGFLADKEGKNEVPLCLTVSFSVDHKPTQKPHVLIKAKDEILFDINARSSRYKNLANCVGKKIIYSGYVKKKYAFGGRANYWSLLIVFQD